MKFKFSLKVFVLVMIVFSITVFTLCKKDDNEELLITTNSIINISQEEAVCGGNIESDGGVSITSRGVCWSTSPNPTVSNSKTINGSGSGSFTSNLSNLEINTKYYVRAYAINSDGTTYGDEKSFTTLEVPNCGMLTDIDGNDYLTVTIGSQCWMQSNLRTTTYNDGVSIELQTSNIIWDGLTTPAYCWYDNDSVSNAYPYGALYNWYAVNTGKLCPDGWHVPTNDEWTTLTTYLGGIAVAGGKLKEEGTTHWSSPNSGASNSSYYSALPGGARNFDDGTFVLNGINGYFWTSTQHETEPTNCWFRRIHFDSEVVDLYGGNKKYGFSVRCIKN